MFKDKKIIDFLFTASPVSRLIFPCFFLFLGIQFEGSDSSPVYKIFMVLVGGMVIAYTWLELFQHKIDWGTTFWTLMVGIPLFFTADYYAETGIKILNVGVLNEFVLLMLCFSYTSICSGLYIARHGIGRFVKWWDIIILIFTLAFCIYIPMAMIGIVQLGLTSYQTMSYMTGFAFLLTLCMILWGDKYERFAIFASSGWRVISYILLVIQLLVCLLSAGRGGFVVLAVGSVYMLIKSHKFKRMFILSIVGGLCTLGLIGFTDNPIADSLQRSTQRTFGYMQGDANDAMQSSGREGAYKWAWEIVEDTNYMGEGVCKGIVDGYPHNIILEFMMQGGVIYTLIWLLVLMATIYKIHNLNRIEPSYILYPLFFYPMIQLVFSGSYLTTPLFWFVITYTFARSETNKYNFK